MKASHVLPAFATLILFACNSEPKTMEPAEMAPMTSDTSPADTINKGFEKKDAHFDTVNDRYERRDMKQIERDTAKVQEPRLLQ